MAHQPKVETKVEDHSLDSLAVYKAISAFLVLATVLYIHSRAAVWSVSKFPLIGQSLGGSSKRRRYFVDHALELFFEGYLKVLLYADRRASILLIISSGRILCGVSLHLIVGETMNFRTLEPRIDMSQGRY